MYGLYDDTIAIVRRREDGSYHVRTYDANTEPSGIYAHGNLRARKGPTIDMNRDGRMDSGRMVTGTYRYVRETGPQYGGIYFRATKTQVAERDTNQDGNFDKRDPNRIDRSGAQRSMLIHPGSNDKTDSAGCQTIRSRDFGSFLDAIGKQRTFSYVLVNR